MVDNGDPHLHCTLGPAAIRRERLVGVAVLLAMWIAHLLLFVRGAGLTAWIGTIVVVQNVVASLFNSHLFDFTSGWLYVFGVGVAGGMVLRQRDCA